MNPLPDCPLLSNSLLPLSLPNVPSFDQMAYNGCLRKSMPKTGMGRGQQMQLHNQWDKDGNEPRQLTAIFQPDDAGEWKEDSKDEEVFDSYTAWFHILYLMYIN